MKKLIDYLKSVGVGAEGQYIEMRYAQYVRLCMDGRPEEMKYCQGILVGYIMALDACGRIEPLLAREAVDEVFSCSINSIERRSYI